MRKSRFTESQIVAILNEGEAGVALSELTRKHGISRATYFNSRAKYGVSVSELKRMKELEAENAKLKRMYAELPLENAVISPLANCVLDRAAYEASSAAAGPFIGGRITAAQRMGGMPAAAAETIRLLQTGTISGRH